MNETNENKDFFLIDSKRQLLVNPAASAYCQSVAAWQSGGKSAK